MIDTPTKLYCANHPQVETNLRCRRCEKPICAKCAVYSPTGYICRECQRGHQKAFETAQWYDYPVSFVLAAAISFIGSLIASYIGFFTIFIAPITGTIIAEVVRAVSSRRRSRRLYQLVAAAVVSGALPLLLLNLLGVLGVMGGGRGGFFVFLPLLWQTLYAFLVTSTMYYRLAGIKV